ncbi:MAG: hypothetical protein WD056_00775 [Gemmatimonadota bacterium]
MTLYGLLWIPTVLLSGPGGSDSERAGLDPPGVTYPDTILVASTPLEAATMEFARGFSDPSGDRLGAILAIGGIRLHIEDTGHAGLSSRQAVAAIREFLRGYDGGGVVVLRAALVEGSPSRGFAELRWSARMAGTSQEIRRTLFLGLYQESGDWRVDEVRLLR